MATALKVKRMTRERKNLEKPNGDYVVLFKDDNCLQFDAYVLGPSDTLYSHKFIKLRFEIVNDYPMNPPKCKFIQYSGGRIHPNLYTEGKVCLSILGTWEGEKWAFAMTCETVMITIRSLLDNKPYTHEPNQEDNPAYNNYVQYHTWSCLFLDYLRKEQEPELKAFLQKYVAENAEAILSEFDRQAKANKCVTSLYSTYGGSYIVVNYPNLRKDVKNAIEECKRAVAQNKIADPVATAKDDDVVEISAEAARASTNALVDAGPKKEAEAKAKTEGKNCNVL